MCDLVVSSIHSLESYLHQLYNNQPDSNPPGDDFLHKTKSEFKKDPLHYVVKTGEVIDESYSFYKDSRKQQGDNEVSKFDRIKTFCIIFIFFVSVPVVFDQISLYISGDNTIENLVPSDPRINSIAIKSDTYSIKVDYGGKWIGSVTLGSDSRKISGIGTTTEPLDFKTWPINVNIQKYDDGRGTLTVDILKGDKEIKTGNTSARRGKVKLTAMG